MHAELFPTWDPKLAQSLKERFEIAGARRIREMSKGEARRVAVACAVAHRPELLLLDEPSSGFDPAARREFLEVALEHLTDTGSTILFSSHQLDDVERLAGRILFLQGSRLVLD
ncbi:MAG: ABC-2 type transport system ATP-binding protein [Planctomycetota bacterium]|jgi:ABC-2 type transport system ATP-binding protein